MTAIASATETQSILWNHQLKAVEFAEQSMEQHSGALLAMEMGTGKTRCALELAARRNSEQEAVRMLVICPNNVISVWVREAASHLDSYRMWTRRDAKGTLKKVAASLKEFMEESGSGISVVVVNYDAISSSETFVETLAEYEWDMVVADESHRLKNPAAKRSKAMHDIRESAVHAIGMTGTPRPNNQMDIWHQASVFTSGVLPKISGGKFSEWLTMEAEIECEPRKGYDQKSAKRYGYLVSGKNHKPGDHLDVIVAAEDGGETWKDHVEILIDDGFDWWIAKSVEDCDCEPADMPNLETREERSEWFRNQVASVMHTIKARDVLDLPEHTVTPLSYISSDTVKEAYEQMIENMELETKQGSRKVRYHIALPGQLQRILCGIMEEKEITKEVDGKEVSIDKRTRKEREFKTDPDHELRKEMLASWMDDNESEEKLVVYCHHQACMDAVHEVAAKRGGSAEMSGRRKDLDEKWRDGDARVAVVSINAGAEGISLVEARCAMFYCHNWSAEKKPQAIARLVRPGQKYPVSIVELEAHIQGRDMAMDQIMLGRVAEKMEDSERWLAGEFGETSQDSE